VTFTVAGRRFTVDAADVGARDRWALRGAAGLTPEEVLQRYFDAAACLWWLGRRPDEPDLTLDDVRAQLADLEAEGT